MSYLKLEQTDGNDLRVPLNQIASISIPGNQRDLTFSDENPTGEYQIKIDYKYSEPCILKFDKSNWNDTMSSIEQLQLITTETLFSS